MAPPPLGLPPRGNSTLSSASNTSTIPRIPRPPTAHADREASTTSSLTIDTSDGAEIETNRPLPKPVGFSEARDVSASSRDDLRRQVLRRKMSLTEQEHRFLESLCVNGNEIEVELAIERLQDDELFFDYQTPRYLKYHSHGFADVEEDDDEQRQSPSPRPALDRQSSVGSQRRLKALEERRNSSMQAKMWKAHESGLAVTVNASKRSLMLRRESSIGSSSGPRRGSETVFRSPPPKNVPLPQKLLMPHRRAKSVACDPPPIPGPSRFMRDSTSSSRKSVTFTGLEKGVGAPKPRSKLLRRSVSDGAQYVAAARDEDKGGDDRPGAVDRNESTTSSIPSLRHAHPIRSDSLSSFPSIHHGHQIRDSEISVSSIPSLHHAHPIRSDSIAGSSIPSLHHGHPIRSNSISSIPSLHHGHPIHGDSTVFSGETEDERAAYNQAIQDNTAILLSKFAASDDIASKWLQQNRIEEDAGVNDWSLPDSVTIPITETHSTEAETDLDTKDAITRNSTSSTAGTGSTAQSKPVLLRLASRNKDEGEGIEITELTDTSIVRPGYISMLSIETSIRTATSWDETTATKYSHSDIFRNIHRSLSDEDMSNMFLGTTAQLMRVDLSSSRQSGYDFDEDESSWDMNSESGRFDSWNILKDDYANGYGGAGTLGFMILGTSADDESAQPHVLSPPLMESLQAFLPYSKSGENFFLKYSMVRDGASMHAFLKRVRGIDYAILALETVDGEVFGAFTTQPWRKNWNYFGTGESFLWRMRRSRLEKTNDIIDQAQLESEIDVYPYTGENKFIQLCTHDRIAVGGGTPSGEKKTAEEPAKSHEWGFGLAIEQDFLQGTSSPCVTFGSPSLSKVHSDGSTFEIVNIELWTLTPCMNVEEAEKLELGRLFLERSTN